MAKLLENWIAGERRRPKSPNSQPVHNPAIGEPVAFVPLSSGDDVDEAVGVAAEAFVRWRLTPAGERIQPLFKLKQLLESNIDEVARLITTECGKTHAEAVAEMRRGIENVEVACGIPLMMQGVHSEDIARGIDETMVRQPLGVVAIITPFNFPGMIPLWFLPYAIATGNTVVLKPSERTPLTAMRLADLFHEAGLPAGVLNIVHGGKLAVDRLLDHPTVRAVSFVGSSKVARHVYSRGAAAGKRMQCQGGAKNTVIVMPDADWEMTCTIVADSAFGCAGQRCLATSIAITVGDAHAEFSERIGRAATNRIVGDGLANGVQMGPVITHESRERLESWISQGEREGMKVAVDGRQASIAGCERGYFLRPTILDRVPPDSELARTELFGPILGMTQVRDLDEAIAVVNGAEYGNQACLFTRSGAAARKFRYEVQAGNVGINLGIAAPMAYFPFSGWKGSFFGDLHAQGRDAIEFYTDKKVIVERWPNEWSRTF